MPSREQLSTLLDPDGTVLLTVECQQGVVGPDSALPETRQDYGRRGLSRTSPGWWPVPTAAAASR